MVLYSKIWYTRLWGGDISCKDTSSSVSFYTSVFSNIKFHTASFFSRLLHSGQEKPQAILDIRQTGWISGLGFTFPNLTKCVTSMKHHDCSLTQLGSRNAWEIMFLQTTRKQNKQQKSTVYPLQVIPESNNRKKSKWNLEIKNCQCSGTTQRKKITFLFTVLQPK